MALNHLHNVICAHLTARLFVHCARVAGIGSFVGNAAGKSELAADFASFSRSCALGRIPIYWIASVSRIHTRS